MFKRFLCRWKGHDYEYVEALPAEKIQGVWVAYTEERKITDPQSLKEHLETVGRVERYIITLQCRRCGDKIDVEDDYFRPHH